MKKRLIISVVPLLLLTLAANAQYRTGEETDFTLETASTDSTVVLTLEDALKIALNENISVKIANKEIQRTEYAKKGTYAALFPQINATGSYQRTLIKNDIRSMMGDSDLSRSMTNTKIGNSNSFSAGASASLQVINSQLWTSIKISGIGVEMAVGKARSSKIEMVSQVKQAYFGVLLAKEAFNVYKDVYENAVENFEQIERKYQAQKASEMEYLRAKTTVSNAIPNVFNAESSIILALWQLKAVIGIDLDTDIDVEGEIDDYADHMFYDIHQHDSIDVSMNPTMRQLDLQAEQLLQTVKLQKLAYVPTLAINAAFQYSSVANDPIEKLAWFPYSYAGLSLSIPICSGGKRLNDVRQAKNQYEQVQLQTTNTERQLKISVKNYLITMETNMKSYYSAEDAVESAQKSYDIVARSYEVGRSTLTDLNDAQLALTQSRLSKSQAVYNFMVAKTNLEQTLGSDEYLDYEEPSEE